MTYLKKLRQWFAKIPKITSRDPAKPVQQETLLIGEPTSAPPVKVA